MTSISKTGRWATGAAVITAALLLAACGSSSSTTASSSSTPAAAASSSTQSQSSSSGSLVIGTTKGAAGVYLTGASGRALYLWVADTNGKSHCSGACAAAWPPVVSSGTPTTSGSATAADVGLITRAGGKQQVTYKGHPLYYFAGDTGAGTTTGQGSNGFGAKWWLVAPSGTTITTSGSPGSSSSSSSSSAAGGWG
jgi:predicted lipoprotein with Yx(FWY)xxD motif